MTWSNYNSSVVNYYDPVLRKVLLDYLSGAKSCVDLGCGNGALTMALALLFQDCVFTGIDLDEKNLPKSSIKNLSYVCGDIADFNILPKADIYLCLSVVEHMDKPIDDLVRGWRKKCKHLVLSVMSARPSDYLEKRVTGQNSKEKFDWGVRTDLFDRTDWWIPESFLLKVPDWDVAFRYGKYKEEVGLVVKGRG
jgi:2-polyprenyl-3-methyl-5-hydroxy-6-metoxy-1,4-benzoquinol methylase